MHVGAGKGARGAVPTRECARCAVQARVCPHVLLHVDCQDVTGDMDLSVSFTSRWAVNGPPPVVPCLICSTPLDPGGT